MGAIIKSSTKHPGSLGEVQGAESILFGASFPWNARSPAASLVKDARLVPAAINFAIFVHMAKADLRRSVRVGSIDDITLYPSARLPTQLHANDRRKEF